jgi:hypothetical protein
MSYKEKIDPTKEGFQELWDSTQDPNIDRLIAGIQKKKAKKEEILKLTGELRNSHTLLDTELLRLGNFTEDYNSVWATKNTFNLKTTEQLQNRTRSQVSRWMKLLRITSPRYKNTGKNSEEPQSIINASYLTYRPYELDMWGPASYGTLVTDLYKEMEVIVNHLDEGEQLCRETLAREEEINNDPEWKENLYDEQYKSVEEKCRDIIEKRYHSGEIDTSNPLLKDMMNHPSEQHFKWADFHKRPDIQFNDFVVTLSTLRLQENEIIPKEHELWDENFDKIKDVRFAIMYADELLVVKKSGKFDKFSILEMMKWCDINISSCKHKDSEHVLFDYIKETYKGTHGWPGWSNIFELNKQVKESVKECMDYATNFERKLNRLKVKLGNKQ